MASGQQSRPASGPGAGQSAERELVDLSIERQAIGAILVEADLAAGAEDVDRLLRRAGLLPIDALGGQATRKLWAACLGLLAQGQPPTLALVMASVDRDPEATAAALANDTGAASPSEFPALAAMVRDLAAERITTEAAERLAFASRRGSPGDRTAAATGLVAAQEAAARLRRDPFRTLVVLGLPELLEREAPPRQGILGGLLALGELAMVFAWRGVGKSYFCFAVALAAALGREVFGFAEAVPRRVVYLDFELPFHAVQHRFAAMLAGVANEGPIDEALFENLRVVTPDAQVGRGLPSIADPAGQAEIEAVIGDAELVILDNLSAAVGAALEENTREAFAPIIPFLLRLRRAGKCVLLVHHENRTGGSRGWSGKEDLLDLVLQLRRPEGLPPDAGAVIEISATKDRHGVFRRKIRADLVPARESGLVWAHRDAEANRAEEIVAAYKTLLTADGRKPTTAAVAEMVGIDRSGVSRYLAKARAGGLI